MRLGIALGAPGGSVSAQDLATLAQEAERLGFATAWTAEAYGCDAATTLAWIAAHTSRIGLGAAVMQIPARTPAMTAMTAATLDILSQGRFHLGLGVSGPAVSEGWHGSRFNPSLARTREYVEIVRMALSGERATGRAAAAATVRPSSPSAADLSRRRRAEGHRAGGGDRRWLARRVLLPGALGRAGRCDPGGSR